MIDNNFRMYYCIITVVQKDMKSITKYYENITKSLKQRRVFGVNSENSAPYKNSTFTPKSCSMEAFKIL